MKREEVEAELCSAFAACDWERAADLGTVLDAMENQKRTASLLSAALWYAQQGLRVFPCQPGLKIPFARTRGVHEATTDPRLIFEWWEQHPQANVAIATGHLVDVVDYDGEQAHASWSQRYAATWGELSILGTVSTPRPGGLHVYVPASGMGNRAAMVPGVDYRGRGGYVLAPPSRTDLGTYRFLRPLRPQGPAHE